MSDDEQVQINSLKKLLLAGTIGYGKSTTGNKLLIKNKFNCGAGVHRETIKLQHGKSDIYEITDCPGFGEVTDRNLFFNQILEHKTDLINRSPFNALILVIKFKKAGDDISSDGFFGSAKIFLMRLATED